MHQRCGFPVGLDLQCDVENMSACPAELAEGLRDVTLVTLRARMARALDDGCRDLLSFLLFPLVPLHHLCDAIWGQNFLLRGFTRRLDPK